MIGRTIRQYRIVDKLGEGGMGVVYKALDTKLDRPAALKFLPRDRTGDGDRRRRFVQEARAASALNHPNIITIYDIDDDEGMQFIAMEYVAGKTLDRLISRGGMAVREVLHYAVQIADALARAHAAGIIHRDLKPSNIMVTGDGLVKILDFGLAKLAEKVAPAETCETVTAAVKTPEGAILGTPPYLSPEQMEGRPADARSDLFAFGCVLYEMLTGMRAFPGKSPAGIVAAVLAGRPRPVHEIAPSVPAAVELILEACLAKDPEERWQSARDMKLALSSLMANGSGPAAAGRNWRNSRAAWLVAALILTASATFTTIAVRGRVSEPPPVRFGIDFGKTAVKVPQGAAPVVSPDGRQIVVAAPDSAGQTQLWLRALDSDQLQPIPGTEGAHDPFWSPDSRSIGFGSARALKRVELGGGAPRTICATNMVRGGAWNRNGVILFGELNGPIYSVPAQGGEPRAVTRLKIADGDRHHVFPTFLPDQQRFLYTAWGNPRTPVRVASLSGGAEAELPVALAPFAYVEPGYLLFPQGGSILAQRFDLKQLLLKGEPVRVADPVAQAPGLAFYPFSVSENGVLAWRTGIGPNVNRLIWLDSSGKEVGAVGQAADYSNPALSPDGKRLAVDVRDPVTRKRDIWLYDLARGSAARVTNNPADDFDSAWAPDGRQIAFTSDRKGTRDLYVKPADGVGEERLLLETPGAENSESWSPDGRLLLYNCQAKAETHVLMLPMQPGVEPKPQLLIAGTGMQIMAQVSPRGQHVAYMSSDSGREEVYVQDFPKAGRRWQISRAGGTEPQWSPDGSGLYYLERAGARATLMAIDVPSAGPNFDTVRPRRMFELQPTPGRRNSYVVGAGGHQFLFVAPVAQEPPAAFTVLLNWQATLKR